MESLTRRQTEEGMIKDLKRPGELDPSGYAQYPPLDSPYRDHENHHHHPQSGQHQSKADPKRARVQDSLLRKLSRAIRACCSKDDREAAPEGDGAQRPTREGETPTAKLG